MRTIDGCELDEYFDLLDGFSLDGEDDFSFANSEFEDESFFGSEEARIEREIDELEARCGFRI